MQFFRELFRPKPPRSGNMKIEVSDWLETDGFEDEKAGFSDFSNGFDAAALRNPRWAKLVVRFSRLLVRKTVD